MLIPMRCFTCGKVLAAKWKAYCELVRRAEDARDDDVQSPDFFFEDVPKGDILDHLRIERICCRRHMLTHVELIDII